MKNSTTCKRKDSKVRSEWLKYRSYIIFEELCLLSFFFSLEPSSVCGYERPNVYCYVVSSLFICTSGSSKINKFMIPNVCNFFFNACSTFSNFG
jgi:hypothetical protein